MGFLGAVAGLAAALLSSTLFPRITLANSMIGAKLQDVDIRQFTWADKPYGIAGHLLLGGLVCGMVGAAYVWRRGATRRLIAVGIATPLGALCCWLAALLSDRMFISMAVAQHGTTVLPLMEAAAMSNLPEILHSVLIAASLTIPIFIGAGPTWFNLGRSLIGAVLAFVFGTVLGNALFVLMIPFLVFHAVTSGTPQQVDIMDYVRPILMAELMGMGAGAGLAFAVAELVWKPAWLKSRGGRTEGRTWSLARPVVRIGCLEGVEVYIPPDGTVAPVHAQIQGSDEAHCVFDMVGGTLVNGQPVQSAWLRDGDVISVGSAQLVYRTRMGRSAERSSPVVPVVPVVPVDLGSAPHTPIAAYDPILPAVAPMAPSTLPSFVLVDSLGNLHPLKPGTQTVGRDQSADIALTWEPSVSRKHAEIIVGMDSVLVRDLGSTNGTFVSGQRVAEAQVAPESDIAVGQCRLKLQVR